METNIKINLNYSTCDIEVRGLSLNRINNLSTLPQAVAENLISVLTLLGMETEKAKDGVNLLLQGKLDIQRILEEVH